MPQSITCACGQKLKAPDTLAGKTVKCPKCKQPLSVPAMAPAAEIDLGKDGSLSGGLDDLLQQEMPTAAQVQPGSSALFSAKSSQSDSFPKWMLWAGGGVVAVALLGIGISVAVSMLSRSGDNDEVAQADIAQGPGADEVKNTDLSTAFSTETVPAEKQPVGGLSAPRSSNENGPQPSTLSNSSGERSSSRPFLTKEDIIPSDSESYAAEVVATQESGDNLDAKTLQFLREQIQNSSANLAPKLGIDSQIESEIRETFSRLAAAYRIDSWDAFQELTDEKRFADTVVKAYEREIGPLSPLDVRTLTTSLTTDSTLAAELQDDKKYLDFSNYVLQRVDLSPNRKNAAVIVYLISEEFFSDKMKYWLCYDDNEGWKFFDQERLAFAMTLSANIARGSGTPAELKAMEPESLAISAVRAAERSEDEQALIEALDRLDAVAKQKLSHFVRHQSRCRLLFDKDKNYRQALYHAELAHAAWPSSPQLFLDRAACYNHLEEYAAAIRMALAYHKRIGPDETYWREIALALYGLDYVEESDAAWERCLEFDSQYPRAVYELALSYLPDYPEKIAPHVTKEKINDEFFSKVIGWLEDDELFEYRDTLLNLRKGN